MLDIYYKIWVDGITKLRSRPENKGIWNFYAIVFISMAMAINLALIMSILQRNILKHTFYDIQFSIFSQRILNQLVSFFVLYLLIFRDNRYEKLITRYKSYNGRLCAISLVSSYFLPFILLIIAYFFNKV